MVRRMPPILRDEGAEIDVILLVFEVVVCIAAAGLLMCLIIYLVSHDRARHPDVSQSVLSVGAPRSALTATPCFGREADVTGGEPSFCIAIRFAGIDLDCVTRGLHHHRSGGRNAVLPVTPPIAVSIGGRGDCTAFGTMISSGGNTRP